jgi:hypothetical protein
VLVKLPHPEDVEEVIPAQVMIIFFVVVAEKYPSTI